MKTKEKIIQESLSLFNDNTFELSTTSLIAKKSDVLEGSLWYHFNSKNDLEQIVFKIYPKLKKLKLFLIKLPNIIFARMSGSGSSIVAYFHSKKATDIAAKKFKRKFNNYWYIKSKTI